MVLACLLLTSIAASAETLAELKAKMDKYADSFHGTLGYSLHFKGKQDEKISRYGDEPFPTASTIKTTIMCEVMHQVEQGKLKWDDQLEVQPGLDNREAGGPSYFFKDGTKLPVYEWLHYMITMSDNTATIRLRMAVGQKNVNEWLATHGFKTTRLLNGEQCDELGLRPLQRQYGLGMTTPNEMVKLIEMIRNGKAGSPASCDRMMRLLKHQFWDDGIAGDVPPGHCASKSGAIDGSRSEVAIVVTPKGEFTLSVYTKEQKDLSWSKMAEGDVAIRTLGAMVWRHYDPNKTWSVPDGAIDLLPE